MPATAWICSVLLPIDVVPALPVVLVSVTPPATMVAAPPSPTRLRLPVSSVSDCTAALPSVTVPTRSSPVALRSVSDRAPETCETSVGVSTSVPEPAVFASTLPTAMWPAPSVMAWADSVASPAMAFVSVPSAVIEPPRRTAPAPMSSVPATPCAPVRTLAADASVLTRSSAPSPDRFSVGAAAGALVVEAVGAWIAAPACSVTASLAASTRSLIASGVPALATVTWLAVTAS